MKLKKFDVIELKDETKAIVLETTNTMCKVKNVDISKDILEIDKGDIKNILFQKDN